MKGIRDLAPEINLHHLRRRYTKKWASRPNVLSGPNELVVRYLKGLDSELEAEDGKMTQRSDGIRATQDESEVDPS